MNINDKERQFAVNPITLSDDKNLFVIVGGNNSGKSTFLRAVTSSLPNSFSVVVNRTILVGEGPLDKNYQKNLDSYLNQTKEALDDNYQRQTRALQDFFNLEDEYRALIIDWYNQYFPNRLYEERENIKNSASSMVLKVGGFSITKQGSGMRSTLEIFIKLFDPSIKVLCIDEPELGLEPYLQKYLFEAIKDKVSPDKKIFIATHSHHFLDHEDVANNYVCERNSSGQIIISQATDLKPIIFRLLGNTLASMLLPEKILILEGSSDLTYLRKCLELLGKSDFAIHNSRSNGNISYGINAITQFLRLNNENFSVYKDNVYVLADAAKDVIVREWKGLLTNAAQLKVLSRNGVEYYYPERILKEVFQTEENRNNIVDQYLQNNPNGFNGMTISKNDLSKKVSELLVAGDFGEVDNELFDYLRTLP